MKIEKSERSFTVAKRFLVGGVNSPVRSFNSVGGSPLFIQRGQGAYLWDLDGNRYIDFVGSWGSLILGHAHGAVLSKVKKVIDQGSSFGAPTELETELAQLICQAVPSIEKVRFVSSGTEAVMTAIRLARAYSKREKIVKFSGCYHGHSDGLLVQAGSGATTLGVPDSLGVPSSVSQNTMVLPYNDIESVQNCFDRFGHEIAAIIVEPIAANMGLVLPQKDFLSQLRKVTLHYKSLLIFDEVITGFRIAEGGAQELFKTQPDLTCLGKIIGGGFPVGAVGGKEKIMEMLSPSGTVYQAGTLSGNPVAMAAGIATLKILKKIRPWSYLHQRTEKWVRSLRDQFQNSAIPVQINQIGSLFTIFFSKELVIDYRSAQCSDTKLFAKFFHLLLKNRIYFPPSQFETAFISVLHSDTLLEKAGERLVHVIKEIHKE